MRNRQIPPEALQYAAAFDAYLRAAPDGRTEREAADRMTATLNVLAEARLSKDPVRAFVNKENQAAA
jgi:hypothetical protein